MSHLEEKTKKCLTDGCDVRILMEGVNERCFACTDKDKLRETKEEFEARYEQSKKKCVARECRADRMEGFVVCWTHSNKNAPIVAEKPPEMAQDKTQLPLVRDEPVATQSHYKGSVEPIDLIRSLGWLEQYAASNVIKYVARYDKKNGLEDLKKAKVYLTWLIQEVEK